MLSGGVLLLWAPVGCESTCDTASCIAEEAVATWPDDPAGVTARVRAISDEITRTFVVARLAEAYPGATGELCVALPVGISRERCERVNNRPHLSVVPSAVRVGAGVGAGGVPRVSPDEASGPPKAKTSSFPPGRPELPAPLKPIGALCERAADRAACLDQAALEAALSGDPGGADAACVQQADARWADECRFSAAENAVRQRQGAAYHAAATLCGASTRFAEECWSHVLSLLPRTIPPPNANAARAAPAIALAERIAEVWRPVSEEAANAHLQRFWAVYFANVYREEKEPDGTPLDLYPAESAPHVRAAVASRLRRLGRLQGSLEAQVTTLAAALSRREVRSRGRNHRPDLVFVSELGSPVTEGPTTYFLGAPRRAVGVDAAQELALVVIESAAHAAPPDRALVEEAAAGSDARMAAEAARLLLALDAHADEPTATN